MNIVDALGLLAGGLTTGSLVPQLIQIIKTKSTRDVSLVMFLMFFAGIVCWLVYGIIIMSIPVIAANSLSMVMTFTILVYKFKYR